MLNVQKKKYFYGLVTGNIKVEQTLDIVKCRIELQNLLRI